MIVRGFEMEKGVDFIDNFSPTPGLAVARLMMSIAIGNGMELHKVDIEQAFLQADKLDEGVNGRYFINPPPGSPEAGNKDVVYDVMKPLYGSPSSPRALNHRRVLQIRGLRHDRVRRIRVGKTRRRQIH